MSNEHQRELNPADLVLPDPTFAKLRNMAVGSMVIGLVLQGISREGVWFSTLYSFMFWLSVALGGLMIVLMQHLTRSGWSVTVRRTAESLASTVWIFPVLFLPIALFGMHELYPWTHPGHVSQTKAKWLNEPFFMVRAAIYFTAWIWVTRKMLRASYEQDKTGDVKLTAKAQSFSAGGMILVALTLSFAAFDWMMSLQPHWYSTIFGVYYFAASMLAGFAVMSLMAIGLRQLPALKDVITPEHLHATGKFLFGFTIFWAYIAFSQFLLIWYANIPEETEFFLHRFHHGWEYVSAALPIAHFGLAFLILLPRGIKRNNATLAFGALFQLFFCALDVFWIVVANKPAEHAAFSLGDLGAFLSIGGIFWVVALRKLKREALVPYKDPRLDEALAMSN